MHNLNRTAFTAATAIVTTVLLANATASTAHYSHSSYSFTENSCLRSKITDPVGIIVSGYSGTGSAEVANLTASVTGSDHRTKRWGKVKISGDAQYGRDHGTCTPFEEGNASGNAARSRYHVRWHQGKEPLENGRWYVAGTPHYDVRCGVSHKIGSWIGPRDMLVRSFIAAGWDSYYRYVDIDNRKVERPYEPCTRNVNGTGRVTWDDQIAWIRPPQ